MLDKWYINMLYFVYRAEKLDLDLEIPCNDDSQMVRLK